MKANRPCYICRNEMTTIVTRGCNVLNLCDRCFPVVQKMFDEDGRPYKVGRLYTAPPLEANDAQT